jgi:hypothetical protein
MSASSDNQAEIKPIAEPSNFPTPKAIKCKLSILLTCTGIESKASLGVKKATKKATRCCYYGLYKRHGTCAVRDTTKNLDTRCTYEATKVILQKKHSNSNQNVRRQLGGSFWLVFVTQVVFFVLSNV